MSYYDYRDDIIDALAELAGECAFVDRASANYIIDMDTHEPSDSTWQAFEKLMFRASQDPSAWESVFLSLYLDEIEAPYQHTQTLH